MAHQLQLSGDSTLESLGFVGVRPLPFEFFSTAVMNLWDLSISVHGKEGRVRVIPSEPVSVLLNECDKLPAVLMVKAAFACQSLMPWSRIFYGAGLLPGDACLSGKRAAVFICQGRI